MFIRIAEVRLHPALADEARCIYAEQAAPRVQAVRGNALRRVRARVRTKR
jgi:hypothetical protein